jgi:hypothetical protein
MFNQSTSVTVFHERNPYTSLIRRLGETFAIRDVMVPLHLIQHVKHEDRIGADLLVEKQRYSVVPVSDDGINFPAVFISEHKAKTDRRVVGERTTLVSDYLPDSTFLSEAFFLFDKREWYLTLHNDRVSGLITYWAFNSREFCVQLYSGLSRLEELSRNVLAKDGCGVSNEIGLSLSPEALERILKRIGSSWNENGGNRFVDELDYHQSQASLREHSPWRFFLDSQRATPLSDSSYDKLYSFTSLRDSVMHGRVLFPTYARFKKSMSRVVRIGEFIELLDRYLGS